METIKSTLKQKPYSVMTNNIAIYLRKHGIVKTINQFTMYPHYDGILNIDLTTQLIMNKVSEMDAFGSINFVNLYSNITTPINLKHLENAYDKHTDIQIMKAVKESDEVILAGAYAKSPLKHVLMKY